MLKSNAMFVAGSQSAGQVSAAFLPLRFLARPAALLPAFVCRPDAGSVMNKCQSAPPELAVEVTGHGFAPTKIHCSV